MNKSELPKPWKVVAGFVVAVIMVFYLSWISAVKNIEVQNIIEQEQRKCNLK